MRANYTHFRCSLTVVLLIVAFFTQTVQAQDSTAFHTTTAGSEYKRSGFYKALFGRNYRKEWTTPVRVPMLYLDKKGLQPLKSGGSNQTKSLELLSTDNRVYTLRSVNKDLGKIIPKGFHNTFVEDFVTDQVSTSHPYGALAVPLLAERAGLFHTNPVYYYLPQQAALDTFTDKYANELYLLEEKPKKDWRGEEDMGNFKKFEDIEDLQKKLLGNNKNQVDQQMFAKQRLLDMLVGDWDRHSDQFKWGDADDSDSGFYKPVPTDRDQAFFKYNGIIIRYIILTAGLKFLKSYDDHITNVKTYAFLLRSMDRWMTNKLVESDWVKAAAELKQALTDSVIDASVKQMPPEIYAIRGKQIADDLKSRRNKIEKYAADFYTFLSRYVPVTGSKENEYFEINNEDDGRTTINIFGYDGSTKATQPFYTRTFRSNETKEVHLYGIAGNDVFVVNGSARSPIRIRVVGGTDKDSIIDQSSGNVKRIHYYDDPDNFINRSSAVKKHFSRDSAVHDFQYNFFMGRKNIIKPLIGWNDEDRLFVGIGFLTQAHKFRKVPFASKHALNLHYSILQNGFSANYDGLIRKKIAGWDVVLKGYYDQVRWINYFGLGNETKIIDGDIDFHRMRSREGFGSVGLGRAFGKNNAIKLSGFYQSVDIIRDTARFIAKAYAPGVFDLNDFAGARLDYNFTWLNDSIVPTRGILFHTDVSHTHNLVKGTSFQKYAGNLKVYIPILSRMLSLAIGAGAATVEGKPEFYQYPSIGESYNLRGFRRERFYGKTTFYNTNELRLMFKFKSYLFNGGLGVMGFFDNGRVWMPNEKSDTWHTSVGGGLIVIPFKLVMAQLTYGVSKEDQVIQLKVRKDF